MKLSSTKCNNQKGQEYQIGTPVLSSFGDSLCQILQHIRKDLVALVELLNGSHYLVKRTVLAGILELLRQIGKFVGMSGIMIDHVVHQRAQLRNGCAAVLMLMMMVMTVVVVMVVIMVMVVMVMMVLVTMLMQMVMGMRMLMIVRMTVIVLMGVGMTVVSVLVGMAVGMLMAVNAIVIVFVTHSVQNSFYSYCGCAPLICAFQYTTGALF